MCKEKPGKVLPATKLDSYYPNATKLPVFCTLRCAANYTLLWIEGIETEQLENLGHTLPDSYSMKPS